MKWVFAFLNGLLIFVNASGLNVMTSSYIFNPKETTENKPAGYNSSPFLNREAYQQAGIFPLPRMINWWPDENLIVQNRRLFETNTKLQSENLELKSFFTRTPDKKLPQTSHADSLDILKSQILNQQRRINELETSLKNTGSELQQKLAVCIRERTTLSDSLYYYKQNFLSCQKLYSRLREELSLLQRNRGNVDAQLNDQTNKLETCMNEKVSLNETISSLDNRIAELNKKVSELTRQAGPKVSSLTELLNQLCKIQKGEIIIKYRPGSDDAKLRQQDFYIRMNWDAFCESFNTWYLTKDAGIK